MVITLALSTTIILLEGVQQLYQWHTNQVSFRSTAEALKQERYLYLAQAGPYTDEERVS
ncbi:MAG: DUF4231 domain-containing protein [Bacteroidales bacterium]